mgnify:CR=1 FL=1
MKKANKKRRIIGDIHCFLPCVSLKFACPRRFERPANGLEVRRFVFCNLPYLLVTLIITVFIAFYLIWIQAMKRNLVH